MKQIFKEITEPKKFIRHLYVAVTYRLVRVIDGWRDRRICGRSLTHPIRLYFMSDQLCWRILKDRPGWTMQFRRTCWKKYGLCMWGATQYYSLWEYAPQKILSE